MIMCLVCKDNIKEVEKRLDYLEERRKQLFREADKFNKEMTELEGIIKRANELKEIESYKKYIGKYYRSKVRREYIKIISIDDNYSMLMDADFNIPYAGRLEEDSRMIPYMLKNEWEEISKDEFLEQFNKAIELVKSLI